MKNRLRRKYVEREYDAEGKKLHWTQTPAGKRKIQLARSNESVIGDAVASPLNTTPDQMSIRDCLELLFDKAQDIREAATQIADRLGLEL